MCEIYGELHGTGAEALGSGEGNDARKSLGIAAAWHMEVSGRIGMVMPSLKFLKPTWMAEQ